MAPFFYAVKPAGLVLEPEFRSTCCLARGRNRAKQFV